MQQDRVYLDSRPIETQELSRYLRSSRKDFLKLYLRHVRVRFLENARLVRQFAADTDAPDLAYKVLRQSARFHAMWLVLRFSLAAPFVGPAWRFAEKLFLSAALSEQVGGGAQERAAESR